MGFIAPYSEQSYLAIVEKNIEVHAPLNGKLEFDGPRNTFEATLEPLSDNNNKQQKLFQYSTDVYTTYQKVDDVKPYLQGQNAKRVHVGPNKSVKYFHS